MDYNILIAGFINTVLVLGLVQLLKIKTPVLKEKAPWLFPIIAGGIGPAIAVGQNVLFAWLGLPIDLSPIAAIFTGATATAVNQVGKQATKAAAIVLLAAALISGTTGCDTLGLNQDPWSKLSDDERSRFVVGGFQDTAAILFDAGKIFITAQPDKMAAWKNGVVPGADGINKLLSDIESYGSTGAQFTISSILLTFQSRILEILTTYTSWGTMPSEVGGKITADQKTLLIISAIQLGTVTWNQIYTYSSGKIPTWQELLSKNALLQKKIEAEK